MRASRAIGLLLLVLSCPARPAVAAEQERPNIILIYADDHAVQAVGAYGSSINRTPNIDRLAREGLVFSNSFVTNSICAPARAVVLTGQFSHVNGVRTNADVFDGSRQTLPKLLASAGYQTALIGKWHLKSDPTGFDHWEVLLGQGPYYNPPMDTPDGRVQHTGYTTDIITDLAIEWLDESRDEDRPFLLMVQHKAPHRNWQPGPDHLHDLEGHSVPEPSTLFDDYSTRASPARNQEMTIGEHLSAFDLKLEAPGNLTDEQRALWDAAYAPRNNAYLADSPEGDDLIRWKYQRYLRDYLRCIASIDDGVGRILDHLDRSGLSENTVVVYSSDQGFYLGEHGWYDKRWMYEPSLRTPMVMRWPGVAPEGVTRDQLVQNIDLAPTFLDAAGVTLPEWMQGRSLVPVIKDDDAPFRDALYYHYYEFPGVHAVARHYGVRTDRHKLIHYYQTDEWELFDLQTDPNELENLYADPGKKADVARLKQRLERLRVEYAEAPVQVGP